MSSDPNSKPPLLTRGINDGPWCWQNKSVLRLIREAFDDTTFLDQALALYLSLTEIASDSQSEAFEATRRKLSQRSGVSITRIDEISKRFAEIKLIEKTTNKIEGTKENAPSTFRLTWPTSGDTSPTLHATSHPPKATSPATDATLLKNQKTGSCGEYKESIEESPEKALSTKTKKLSAPQKELAEPLQSILGDEWCNDAGKWVIRIKEQPDDVDRVLRELENAIKENRIKKTPAAFAEDTWKRFGCSKRGKDRP